MKRAEYIILFILSTIVLLFILFEIVLFILYIWRPVDEVPMWVLFLLGKGE